MELSRVLAYAVAAAIIVVIPGPSVLFAIGRALSVGRRSAWFSVAGNAFGVLVQVLAVSLGLGAVIATSAVAFTVVKLAGAGYLVYLGVQAWRHRNDIAATQDGPDAPTDRRSFTDGVVVGVTNPKSLVFLGALLPQFLSPNGWPPVPQLLTLGGIFCVIALILDSVWVIAASAARTWFAHSPNRVAHLRGAGGIAMVTLGLLTATVRRT